MKKLLFIVWIFLFSVARSQDFSSRVPQNVFGIVHYAGKTLTNTIPITKLDKYGIVKNDFFKALHLDTAHTLSSTGIDFSSDIYQYAFSQDSILGFVTLFNINNLENFINLVDANYGAELRPIKRDGFEMLYLSANSAIAWNGHNGVYISGVFMGKKEEFNNGYSEIDSLMGIEPVDSIDLAPPKQNGDLQSDSIAIFTPHDKRNTEKEKKSTGKTRKKKGSAEPAKGKSKNETNSENESTLEPPVVQDEEVPSDSANIIPYFPSENDAYDQWKKRQDSIAKYRVRTFADSISSNHFKNVYLPVSMVSGYDRVVDNNAGLSVWLNTKSVFKLFGGTVLNKSISPFIEFTDLTDAPNEAKEGFCTGTNFYFLKDKVHTETRTYTFSENTRKELKALYKQHARKSTAGFINPQNLGYVSVSFNSEAAIRSYYNQLKKYFSYYNYTREYSDLIGLYIDLMEIIIDEKGISDLFPGNYLMVLHGLGSKQVKYTSYEYDSSFEYKPIEKIKDQPSPDFSFVMDTRRSDFVQKAIEIPLKYAEKNNFNYIHHSDYYELKFPEGESVLNSLYFMVADGRFVVTTNIDVIQKVMHGQPFDEDKETSKRIAGNNLAAYLDLKGILNAIKPQISDGAGKQTIEYLSQNLVSINAYSGFKNGEMKGEANFQISDEFENSLIGIFEMIEKVAEIKKNADQDALNKQN